VGESCGARPVGLASDGKPRTGAAILPRACCIGTGRLSPARLHDSFARQAATIYSSRTARTAATSGHNRRPEASPKDRRSRSTRDRLHADPATPAPSHRRSRDPVRTARATRSGRRGVAARRPRQWRATPSRTGQDRLLAEHGCSRLRRVMRLALPRRTHGLLPAAPAGPCRLCVAGSAVVDLADVEAQLATAGQIAAQLGTDRFR
jgi:hypothetical protein